MKLLFVKPLFFTLIGILFINGSAFSNHYYVDMIKGNDNNNGLAKSSAWKTLSKVSKTLFKPGDNIAFKSGQRFIGVLAISSITAGSFPSYVV